MYYPYIRGKQYDLLALKELNERGLLNKHVMPIIEPVKDSAALLRTVESFAKKQQPLLLIENPQVGSYLLNAERMYDVEQAKQGSVHAGLFLTEETNLNDVAADSYLFATNYSFIQQNVAELQAVDNPLIISDESRIRTRIRQNRIILQDHFTRLKHAEQYVEVPDEFFSNTHLFYREEGFEGFADYSIDGSRYLEKGFPAPVIVLHILYFDRQQNLRIKHFVSDTMEGMGGQKEKFQEALAKLASWYDRYADQLILTEGLAQLLTYQSLDKFPGLGTIKKLSLMHHLELMSRFFAEKSG